MALVAQLTTTTTTTDGRRRLAELLLMYRTERCADIVVQIAVAFFSVASESDKRSRPSKQRASLRPLWTIEECASAPQNTAS